MTFVWNYSTGNHAGSPPGRVRLSSTNHHDPGILSLLFQLSLFFPVCTPISTTFVLVLPRLAFQILTFFQPLLTRSCGEKSVVDFLGCYIHPISRCIVFLLHHTFCLNSFRMFCMLTYAFLSCLVYMFFYN